MGILFTRIPKTSKNHSKNIKTYSHGKNLIHTASCFEYKIDHSAPIVNAKNHVNNPCFSLTVTKDQFPQLCSPTPVHKHPKASRILKLICLSGFQKNTQTSTLCPSTWLSLCRLRMLKTSKLLPCSPAPLTFSVARFAPCPPFSAHRSHLWGLTVVV